MSSRPRSRLLALVLSIVPGWGHVYWGREVLGLTIFTATAVAGFALLNGLFVWLGPARDLVVRGAAAAFVGILAWSWVDILRRTAPGRAKAEEEARDHEMKEGMIAYLRGEHEKALALFEGCVRADPFDAEALFRTGMACSRSGRARDALAWFRRLRRHDLEEKWRWEVAEEIRRLKRRTREAKAAPARVEGGREPPAAPRVETTRVEMPRAEMPRAETPRAETPRAETTRAETTRAGERASQETEKDAV